MRSFLAVSCAALVAGCAGLLPGGETAPDTFDLTGPPRFAPAAAIAGPAAPRRQILIVEPTALKLLDSEQIVVRTGASAVQYLADSQWNDRLPSIVQARLVQAMEDSGKVGGVGRPGDGLAIDFRVITTIRAFEISTVDAVPTARVEISARLLNDRNGVVRAQRVFAADVPVAGTGNAAFVAALERAFEQATADIVSWTLANI